MKETIFKVFNVLIMGVSIIYLLIMIVSLLVVDSAFSGADEVTRGGATFFTMFALLPAAIEAVVSVLAGKAGLQGDPYACRKYAKWLLIWQLIGSSSSIVGGSLGAKELLLIAFYGAYVYLAHTASY